MASMTTFSVYFGFASVLLVLATVEASPISSKSAASKPTMPPGCEGQDFCTKNTSYPTEVVEKLLDYQNVTLNRVRESPIKRNGFEEVFQTDCKKTFYYDPIYEIVDVNQQVRYVVQSKDRFEQIQRREECTKPGRLTNATEHFTSDMVKENTINCTTMTMPYDFLVLNFEQTGFELVQSRSQIPVQCACLVVNVGKRRVLRYKQVPKPKKEYVY